MSIRLVVTIIAAPMELLADRDPEEARKLLDPILERSLVAARRGYQGVSGGGPVPVTQPSAGESARCPGRAAPRTRQPGAC